MQALKTRTSSGKSNYHQYLDVSFREGCRQARDRAADASEGRPVIVVPPSPSVVPPSSRRALLGRLRRERRDRPADKNFDPPPLRAEWAIAVSCPDGTHYGVPAGLNFAAGFPSPPTVASDGRSSTVFEIDATRAGPTTTSRPPGAMADAAEGARLHQ